MTQCTSKSVLNICGIYKITSPSGKVYVGSAKKIKDRIRHYRWLDCKAQRKLYNSIKKYGWDSHRVDILDTCNEPDLFKKERYYCDLFNVLGPNGLNLSIPGYDDIPKIDSQETREKKSISQSGIGNNFYGKKHTPEARKKISEANSYKSPETLRKMREVQLGKTASKEARAKMSISQKGRTHSAETKEKMRLSSNKIKWIICLENGVFYLGIKEAAKAHGYSLRSLSKKLNGSRKNNTSLLYA